MRKILTVLAVNAILLCATAGFAFASHLLTPFTQTELDTNWEADRQFPTDGVTSVIAFGRDDVARIGINSSAPDSSTFRRTEGIKTVGVQNFGNKVQVDLYVDPDWEDNAVRAGFWVVGDDGIGNRDNFFGILEFVNLEPSTSGDSAQGNHEGWRFWDSTIGWTDLETPFTYGEWVTLAIELDADNEQYNYYINEDFVDSAAGGEHFIRELFLNSYNYGLDEFPNLNNDSYVAHWHVGVEDLNLINVIVSGDTSEGFNQPGWLFNRDVSTSTPFEFNTDQASIGTGSLYVSPIGENAPNKFIAENFLNELVADVEMISSLAVAAMFLMQITFT